MKFCKDCRFYSDSYCFARETAEEDPVTGLTAVWADRARRYVCGVSDAKFFQPRLIARIIGSLKGWK